MTFKRGWFCPKCNRVTEHKIEHTHVDTKYVRCIRCQKCGSFYPVPVTSYFNMTPKRGGGRPSNFKSKREEKRHGDRWRKFVYVTLPRRPPKMVEDLPFMQELEETQQT